jgi:hypothetical protein
MTPEIGATAAVTISTLEMLFNRSCSRMMAQRAKSGSTASTRPDGPTARAARRV